MRFSPLQLVPLGDHLGQQFHGAIDAKDGAVQDELVLVHVVPPLVGAVIVVAGALLVGGGDELLGGLGVQPIALHDAVDALFQGGGDEHAEQRRVVPEQVVGPAANDDAGALFHLLAEVTDFVLGHLLLEGFGAGVHHQGIEQAVGGALVALGQDGLTDPRVPGHGLQDVLVVEIDPQLFGQLLADLVAAAAELSANGNNMLHSRNLQS